MNVHFDFHFSFHNSYETVEGQPFLSIPTLEMPPALLANVLPFTTSTREDVSI